MRITLHNRKLSATLATIALLIAVGTARAQLTVESVSIANGAVNVPEVTDVSVTFSSAIAPIFLPGALDALGDALPIDIEVVDPECPIPPAGIFVFPGGCPTSVSLSGDGRTVTLEGAQLESDDDHTLIVLYAVGQGGETLAVPHVTRFSTGSALPQGGISGSVSTSEGSPAGTILLAVQAPLDFASEDFAVEPNIAFADMDGNYSMDFVPDGTYHVIGFQADLTDPETALNNVLIGTVDVDGNSVSDIVEVAGGNMVSGADVTTSNEGATAAELNTAALDLVHEEAADATLGLAAGAGMNLDGTALSWIYLYTSLQAESAWVAAGLGSFVFPPQLLDIGEEGDLILALFGAAPVPADFGDSDFAVDGYLDAGGLEFLSEYEAALGAAVLMNADLYEFIQILLEGDLDGFLEPVKQVFGRVVALQDLELTLAKTQTGEVWIVAYVAPFGPGLHLVAMDDAGNPLLVLGSSSARENEEAAAAVAGLWASDAALVMVTTQALPVDGRGNSIAWNFNYYSASKDSVYSVSASGGTLGGVIPATAFAVSKEEVPSTSALPDNWIDSPAAVLAGRDRGEAFAEAHADALASAVLSRGLQLGDPDRAIWRFGFTGTSSAGEPESLDIDLDAQSGVFVAVEDDGVTPSTFELGQNYPNPFNPSTILPYRVGERGHVTLEVFDALGRRVATLVDAVQPAGSYTATWDASQTFGSAAPSGVYVYRLRTEESVSARSMLLVK